ncbi:MAG: type IV pilus twitching motility protein PilT [Candidatus Hydrogenedentales bacterium]|jgi:twitching motility protein PilT
MAEHIVGIGGERSILEAVAIAAEELGVAEGHPKKIKLRADTCEIVAERADYESPFSTFTLRIRSEAISATALQGALAAGASEKYTLTQDEGWQVLRWQETAAETTEAQQAEDREFASALKLPEVWRIHGADFRVDEISPHLLFQAMVQYKASDVHLFPGAPPVFRVDNKTQESKLIGALSAHQIRALIREIAAERYWEEFERDFQTSFNYHQSGLGYARVSAFTKNSAPHCTFRFLPEKIPSFEELNIPHDTMVELGKLHHGLILITGMTGSGKSTTMAALVDWINANKAVHILCIENPVEYVHVNRKAVVSQRSTGSDVRNFFDAVTGALRHDPDVIVIGEMRDPDTIRAAINAAATGHLVLSTLHSNTASEVINRIVSFFDPVERDLVRLQLRDCIRCVLCQRLVPRIGGGRVPTLEFLFNDIKPITDAIIAGNTDALRIGMQQTVSHSFLFEEYLYKLYKRKIISLENAREFTTDVSVLDQMLMGTYSVPRLDSIKAAH